MELNQIQSKLSGAEVPFFCYRGFPHEPGSLCVIVRYEDEVVVYEHSDKSNITIGGNSYNAHQAEQQSVDAPSECRYRLSI